MNAIIQAIDVIKIHIYVCVGNVEKFRGMCYIYIFFFIDQDKSYII